MAEKLGLRGGSTGVMNTRAMCLEKISEDPFVNMAGHPNGSTRDVFLSSQDGKIWLASVPVHGAGDALHYINGGSAGRPFLDLTDRLRYNDDDDPAIGLRGVAFHPEFSTNGRFFVAYTCGCDNTSTACTGDGGCWVPDPGNRPRRCRYQLVVAEYRAQGGDLAYSKVEPSEVRRFFAMGLSRPKKSYSYQHHGGQLLFRPGNGLYLYLIVGQEFVWFQNQRSLPSKIIRFDIDRATPKAEIYAGGVSNPSGCSFDSGTPSDLYCAEVDQVR
ncbi:hypothetical protein EJB05_01111 [Eragrostis curvula]|uniref:Glucose/Sorbosone dehydrogenase domain-containing protein n=1 Tax=Eragrostis curvula TaxID=38414 RepID=A0A5J9WPF4_9POAL|nr:hypothetical protein EJB05_01111 [Eragrostis curvula]